MKYSAILSDKLLKALLEALENYTSVNVASNGYVSMSIEHFVENEEEIYKLMTELQKTLVQIEVEKIIDAI